MVFEFNTYIHKFSHKQMKNRNMKRKVALMFRISNVNIDSSLITI